MYIVVNWIQDEEVVAEQDDNGLTCVGWRQFLDCSGDELAVMKPCTPTGYGNKL